MKNLKALILVISSFLFTSSLSAANRYWIATTTANWNSTLNWSTTSGGAGGASVPGSADVAIFNAAKVGSCTINANVNVLGISIVSGYTGTISKGTFTMTVGTTGYSQAAGTFSGGSGTISAKLFTLTGGTFTSTSGNFTVGTPVGNATIFTHSGGTFNHNNGTVTFGANTSTAVYTVDVITGTLFYNVVANLGTGLGTYNSTIQSAGTDTVKAANTFTHSSSTLKGFWRTQGNLIVSSAANGGTGQIIMFGTGNKSYSYSSGRTCNLVINKSSGVVSPLSLTNNLSVQGFKLLAGSFTAPADNFNIGGTLGANATVFDHVAGTYTHNSGTTVFDMNGSFIFTIKTLNTTVLNHVTINSKGTQVLQNATDTLRANNLTLTQGAFNTGIIQVKGNATVTNTFGGTGKIAFMGTVDQNFTLTGATDKFNVTNLIIKQSPGKKVVLQSAAILDQSGQSVTFTRGNIVSTATNLLTIGHGVTVSGMSNSSYVDGPMKKVGNAAFTFPVGKNGHYRKIGISAPAVTTDAYTAEYFDYNSNNQYSHDLSDGTINEISRKEYWNLNRTTGTTNVSVTLSWDSAISCGIDNVSNLKVAAWNGSMWKDKGNGGTTGNVYIGTVVSNGVSSTYGVYALGTSSVLSCFSENSIEMCGEYEYEADTTNYGQVNNYIISDRFGNSYTFDEIKAIVTGNPVESCVAGMFTLFFNDVALSNGTGFDDANNGAARRALVCRVFEDLSELFNHPGPDGRVRINILQSLNTGIGFAATASSNYYHHINLTQGILYGDVYHTIVSGTDAYINIPQNIVNAPPATHGRMQFDFGFNYFLDADNPLLNNNLFDLYTITLHEAIHTLGFASAMNSNGTSNVPWGGTDLYHHFDEYLEDNGVNYLNNTGGYNVSFNGATDPTTGCNDGRFSGLYAPNEIVHAPMAWDPGSSLSHYQCTENPGFCPISNYVMKYCVSPGPNFVNRRPNQEEYNTLCDLGYLLTTTYGQNNTLYNGYATCQNFPCEAYGVNDMYIMEWADGPLAITTAQNNDLPTGNITITNVQVLEGGGNFVLNGNTITFTPAIGGWSVLSYIPECGGNEGNITYIYIWVGPEELTCASVTCDQNIVCHGDFEQVTDDNFLAIKNFNLSDDNSPDIVVNGVFFPATNWPFANNPIGACGNPVLPAPDALGGNNYMGIATSSGTNLFEGICLQLATPMAGGSQFDLSFLANVKGAGCVPELDFYLSNTPPCPLPGFWECPGFNANASFVMTDAYNFTGNWVSQPYLNLTVPNGQGAVNFLTIVGRDVSANTYIYIDNVSIIPHAEPIDITTVVSDNTPCPNTPFTIQYNICNPGNLNTGNIQFIADIPPGFSVQAGGGFDALGVTSIFDLDPNECVNPPLILTLTPDGSTLGTSSVISLEPTENVCNSNLTDVTVSVFSDILTIEKTITNGSSFEPGDQVDYSIEICNTSATTAVTDIVITDDVPLSFLTNSISSTDFTINGNTLTRNIANLPFGQCYTYTFSADINPDYISACGNQIENCASITEATGACILPTDCETLQVVNAPGADLQGATYNGGNNLGSIPVSGGVINGQTFSVCGNLTINQNLTFTNCTITMCPDAQIILLNNADLIVNDTWIHAACPEMWDEITVNDGSHIEVINGSLIEDALVGVHVLDDATLEIDGAIFNKNLKHIYIDNNNGATGHDPGTVLNSDFLCQGNPGLLLPPHNTERTLYGIEIEGAIIMNIGLNQLDNNFSNAEIGIFAHNEVQLTASENHITDCWTGIAMRNMFGETTTGNNFHSTIQYNTFTNCDIGVWFWGNTNTRMTVTKGNIFTDCHTGLWSFFNQRCQIRVDGENQFINSGNSPFGDEGWGIAGSSFMNPNDNSNYFIHLNTFTNLRFGIYLMNTFGAIITQNTIEVNDYPFIQGNPWTEPAGGIWLQYNLINLVKDNIITGTYADDGWQYWRSGIRSDMVPIARAHCNTIEDIDIGLDVVGPQPWSAFKRNTLQGFQLAGMNINGCNTPWGNGNTVPDNEWINSGVNNPYDNFGNHTYAVTNLNGLNFRVRNGAPSIYNPGAFMINGEAVSSFAINPNAISPNHSVQACEDVQYFLRPIEDAHDIAQSTETTTYSKMEKYMTYLLLKCDTLLPETDSLLTESMLVDSIYLNDSLLLAFKDSIEATALGEIDAVLDAIALNMTTGAAGSAGLLITELNGITPTDSIEYFMKKMGLLALNRAAVNDFEYTESEVEDLRELAQKCPMTFGPGVFMARMTLGFIDSIPVMYQSECEAYYPLNGSGKWDGEEPSVEQTEETDIEAEFVLYPNPNDGNMYLEYRHLTESARFELYDVTGRKVRSSDLRGETGKLNINETNLSNGIYLYRIVSDTHKFKFGKVIISK
jgi:hypothetical protein